MSILYGIDVSEHNGTIDWQKVKDSGKVDFAILRAGYGQTMVDKQFRNNALMCNTLGIPIGVYWFSYAKSVDDAVREARACIETIKDYKITYPVAFDFEDDSVRVAKNAGISIQKNLVTLMAASFLKTIEAAGYTAINYSNPSYLSMYFDQSLRDEFSLWLAQWPVNPNPEIRPSQNPMIWQYSAKGRIPGISTDVDLDVSYSDYSLVKTEKETTSNMEPITMDSLVKALNFEKQKSWFENEKGDETYLELAKRLGFTDGTRPYEIPSRAEVMTMTVRAMLLVNGEIAKAQSECLNMMYDKLNNLGDKDDGK